MVKLKKKEKLNKFCIFTSQRSGSSWLVSLLNSHPEITTFHEIFLEKESVEKILPQYHIYRKSNKIRRPLALFRYLDLLDSYPGNFEMIGFKVMYNQLIRHPELLAAFAKDKYKMIHLVRENHLDRYISSASMEQNKLVHSTERVKALPVTLNNKKLIKYLSWQERQVKIARYMLAALPVPVLEITYQDLAQENHNTMRKIAGFLELNLENDYLFTSNRQKINGGGYKEKLANYSETVDALAGTKFEYLIHEPQETDGELVRKCSKKGGEPEQMEA